MKDWLLLLAGICVILGGCFLAYPMLKRQALLEINGQAPIMEASVKILVGSGSGSGVHIGDGKILTAAHVVSSNDRVRVEYYGGGLIWAKVIWTNREFDVALIKVERRHWAQVAPLDCAPNTTGQKVFIVGNPMDVAFVWTRGEVVGPARKHGPWAQVVPVDGRVIYGQSGGGVIDFRGRLVGIAVGLLPTPYGIAAFGWIVPAESVCQLLSNQGKA